MSVYDKIYKRAEPFWETRKNSIHIPISYKFAKRLLTHYPTADEAVVLPAILLHDVGWKMVPEENQLDAFGPKATDKSLSRLHETEGARIAKEILTSLDYDKKKTKEILAIVDGHDTRKMALSLNDKLVKDADKLWRFTPVGVTIDYTRFGLERDAYVNYLGTVVDKWFFTAAAKDMARKALEAVILDTGQDGLRI